AFLSELTGVSCTSETACTAVGRFQRSSPHYQNLAEQWDGAHWTIVRSPNPAGALENWYTGVSCTSATSCMAVGVADNGGPKVMAARWTGAIWKLEPPQPSDQPRDELTGVSCVSDKLCFAVGDKTMFPPTLHPRTLVEKWNGTAWSILDSPNASGVDSSVLEGVSCPEPGVCRSVGSASTTRLGYPLTERWNGTTWAIVTGPKPLDGDLHGVSCRARDACVA